MTVRKTGCWLVPMIGMIFFWRYFRFQSFFGVLYPLDLSYNFLGIPVHISLLFLAELLVLGCACIALRRRVERLISSKRAWILMSAVFGSVGMVITLVMQQGNPDPLLIWVASVFIAIGFIANYLSWAMFFSSDFGIKGIFLLAFSYLASLVIFPVIGFFVDANQLLTCITPVVVGAAWFFTEPPRKPDFNDSLSSLRSVGPYVPLFIVFLLAGSVIRGIVDIGSGDSHLRWGVSLCVGIGIFLSYWYFCGKPNPFSDTWPSGAKSAYASVEGAVFKSWIILVFLFLLGLFVSLVVPSEAFGGEIVVIARSFLDFFLWVLLCNLAYSKKISPILLFVSCSLVVEAASWCLSYVVMPLLLSEGSGGSTLVQNNIVLVVVFVLFSAVTVAFSFIIRKQPGGSTASPSNKVQPGGVPPEMAEQYNLTRREAEIINLFVHGRSMRKVASILVISPSTVQTHIKSAYRKLDVHTKDELVDLLDDWDSR